MGSASVTRKDSPSKAAAKRPAAEGRKLKPGRVAKQRVLIEFPPAALRRADEAAHAAGVSRSEFIRTAVERRLDAIVEAEFERELEESYKANAEFNLRILKEFEHVDRDTWEAIP